MNCDEAVLERFVDFEAELSLVAALEFGFYGGNIVSAVGRARRFNRLAWQTPTDALARQHGPQVAVAGDEIVLTTP